MQRIFSPTPHNDTNDLNVFLDGPKKEKFLFKGYLFFQPFPIIYAYLVFNFFTLILILILF